MKTLHLGVLLAFAVLAVTGENIFRSDYKYHASANAWFKFHKVPSVWALAELRCFHEGSVLASPLDKDTMNVMNTIINENVEVAVFGVHVGINNKLSNAEYTSVEGVPLSDMPVQYAGMFSEDYIVAPHCMRMTPQGNIIADNCSAARPYICYKKKTKNLQQTECGTIDEGYNLDNRTGQCYKFHNSEVKWPFAYLVCAAEGGHLAVVNSPEEATVLQELFAKNPPETIVAAEYNNAIHIGFSDWHQRGTWRTIHGQTLEDAGFSKWDKNEQDETPGKFCGALYRTNHLVNTYCEMRLPFICEKDPHSLRTRTIHIPKQYIGLNPLWFPLQTKLDVST